jgi:alkylation response protein AidB-like acyl-CoA dehydrogenase
MGSSYRAPLRDIRFALYDVLDADALFARLGFRDATRDVVDAVLEEGARFTGGVLAPLNAVGDREGCRFDPDTGAVATPPGFAEAYARYVDGGWPGLVSPVAHGGQGLPHSVGVPIKEMIDAANLAWGNFPLLSHGATEALLHHADDALKARFLPPLVEGRWTGTMCLTEPHCGTDLGLIRTRAEPRGDGTYAVTGTKIFITAGEHDLAENIVHLVLAKLPDAPEGSRGISMFLVPKRLVDDGGTPGARNAVRAGAIEHKMGIHGSATCVLNFDGATGWLVGEAHRGLQAMFVMMNTARLAVGLQGLGLADRAHQNAVRYARERLQGRAPGGAAHPDKPADPILVHPDVRRMLLTCQSLVEGGRLLGYHAATLVDIAAHAPDAAEREEAEALLAFLTPITKACLTEWGVECTNLALQCFGGHGYIVEHGMEQLARDARITTLYEGTTGVQALDLVGRKLLQQRGEGLRAMLRMIGAFCDAHADDDAMAETVLALRDAAVEWQRVSERVATLSATDPAELGAASVDYLFLSGYVVLGYWWAMSVAAVRRSGHPEDFRASKQATARFYFSRVLPRIRAHAAAIEAGARPLMAPADRHFDAVRD